MVITVSALFNVSGTGTILGNTTGFSAGTAAVQCGVGGSSSGGCHGGFGAVGTAAGALGSGCGSHEWPSLAGSGGVGSGGRGGTALAIIANTSSTTTVVIQGLITVNGGVGVLSGICGGGGAGALHPGTSKWLCHLGVYTTNSSKECRCVFLAVTHSRWIDSDQRLNIRWNGIAYRCRWYWWICELFFSRWCRQVRTFPDLVVLPHTEVDAP